MSMSPLIVVNYTKKNKKERHQWRKKKSLRCVYMSTACKCTFLPLTLTHCLHSDIRHGLMEAGIPLARVNDMTWTPAVRMELYSHILLRQ